MSHILLNADLVNQIHQQYESEYRSTEVDPYGQPYPKSPRITKSEIKQVLTCRANEDFTPLFDTELYQKRSGAYTRLLFIIECCLGGQTITLNPKLGVA